MKNRIIIIGLIFNIVFQSFGLQPNNFAEKKSNKTTYKKSENSDNSNDLKSLFFEEESEENTDDESKLIHRFRIIQQLKSILFNISKLQV
jgi:hypothetical protein